MIVCILFALLLLLLCKKGWYNLLPVKIMVYCMSLMLIFTVMITSRSYQAKSFNLSYPLKECKIIHERGDLMRVSTPKGEWLVDKSKIIEYEAPDKESEVLEVRGEHRLYSYSAPDILYYLYYLDKKTDTTEDVIGNVNVSKCK